ncbi:MAG: DUF4352 domain-containing protein [Oscillospiraceae bacterium]|nr:DUF4352 domain-containing protein [Oscillospiraceae bacterium]
MKKTTILCALLAGVIAMTGCGGNTSGTAAEGGSSDNSASSTTSTTSEDKGNDEESSKSLIDDIASSISQAAAADGREYGKTYTAKIGEKLKNEFFAMTVNEAYRMTSVSGYVPDDESYEYLCVNVTCTNIFSETINVGAYDFDIRWGDGDDEVEYAIYEEDENYGYDLYPGEYDLPKNKSVTGNIYFFIPKDVSEVTFEYVEIYEDDFNGNTYQVPLSDLEYVEDPNASAFQENWGVIGDTLTTSEFDLTVNDAKYVDEVEDYYVDDSKFLAVDITVKNNLDEAVEAGAYYFLAYWGMGDDEYAYAVENEEIVDYPINVELAAGESLSGTVYFIVPADVEPIIFEYSEYFTEETGAYYSFDLFNSSEI